MVKFSFVGKVIKVGNSFAAIIPKKLVDLRNIRVGDIAKTEFERVTDVVKLG